MSGIIFQNVVLQFKDSTSALVGVLDSDGTIIACTELPEIGKRYPDAVAQINRADGECVFVDGRTYRPLGHWDGQFDFAVFTDGEDAAAQSICMMASVALNVAKTYYEEKHDKSSFIKNIISDNIMHNDVYIRAKELHVDTEASRGVLLIRRVDSRLDAITPEAVLAAVPDRQSSFALTMGDSDVVLIVPVKDDKEIKELYQLAERVEKAICDGRNDGKIVIGIGTIATHLRDLGKSYKEAQIAIEVGKVFDIEKYVINYENLGIGRLIYQLPTTLCEMFLQEVFKKNPIDALDKETLFTINKFFENNLVLSETARKLFVHRNTLVYRLEKIKKLTGLDLRQFDDAITFKVALMVRKYLASRGIEA